MGFGTLFIGYFLILNIAYYGFTDVIAALVMLLGLYKLSGVNKPFKYASYTCLGFSVFALAELFIQCASTFFRELDFSEILPYIDVCRIIFVFAVTLFALMGMRDVAGEVGLSALSGKCSRLIPLTAVTLGMWLVLEAPLIVNVLPINLVSILAVITILSFLVLTCIILSAIWGCYMKICMPDQVDMPTKESRFAFVNEYRKREEKKQEEYAKYRIDKKLKKGESRKKK